MSINIIIVFGLHISYLCIHFSFACFNQCNNIDSGTCVATVNQNDTLVESDESLLSSFGGISNNSLIHLLQLNNNEVDEQKSHILKHSSHYDADQFAQLTDGCRHNFRILTLYIESIMLNSMNCLEELGNI